MPAVITTGGPRGPEKHTHEEAADLGVDEGGTLIVTARKDKGEWVIAVYAAGAWLHAEIT
ncbi:hypothetical protein [Actinocrinis sp.]|uniref:hypothetical protein n=1 Tax=Actinocrinis sp. TaxID=1920516 RepID=UPI002D714D41|nr:hypothetical protein [Actinocrinis sp.]HZP55040.1 hypothetical protein [Actinocrinis sp.]